MTRRFQGRVEVWDVINEAHGAANCLHYSYEQLLDLTVATCAAARQGDGEATMLVNCTDPWGLMAAADAPATTLRYCRDIVAAGADFDVLGMQLYVGPGLGGVRDLFEFSRMLDVFGDLGKPMHITEMGVPSSCEPDILAGRKVADIGRNGWWHAPWSEAIQAQWVREFLAVAASKPFLHALSWWDFADDGRHFHTHGGLLRRDLTPKPALANLRPWRD
jgi:GH35 family endo-1,4-beta-xylanase